MAIDTVLFDLDGTLTDPLEGITASLRYALGKMGAPVAEADDLRWCIGPPLRITLPTLLGTSDASAIEQAIAHYRDCYNDGGIFACKLYDGVAETLADLARSFRLFVATAKPTEAAKRVVGHYGLLPHFSGVYGCELAGRFDDKADLIAHMIVEERINPARAMMVGDRAFDMVAACKNGLRGIGAAWGYGSADELTQAGAVAIAEKMSDVPPLIRTAG